MWTFDQLNVVDTPLSISPLAERYVAPLSRDSREVGCCWFLLPPELLLELGPKLLVAGLQSLLLDRPNRLNSLSPMTDETNWKVSTANGVSGGVVVTQSRTAVVTKFVMNSLIEFADSIGTVNN